MFRLGLFVPLFMNQHCVKIVHFCILSRYHVFQVLNCFRKCPVLCKTETAELNYFSFSGDISRFCLS